MSNSTKRQLRKARQQLHAKSNLVKLYRDKLADPNALVDYVQGLAALGQYTLEVMVAQSPERAVLVWQAIRAWATMNGMLVQGHDGKLTITKVYQRADETPVSTEEAPKTS